MVVLFSDEGRCLYLASGEEDRGSCLEVFGERTKRKGVWLVTSLNVEKRKSLVGKTPGGVYCS